MKDYDREVRKIVARAESFEPFRICKFLDIDVMFHALGERKAYTTVMNRIRTIVINEDLDEIQARYSCAHELGHIMMKHDYNKIWMENKTNWNTNRYENEANLFAIHLLMYPYKEEIKGMEYGSYENIGRLTGIPFEYFKLL